MSLLVDFLYTYNLSNYLLAMYNILFESSFIERCLQEMLLNDHFKFFFNRTDHRKNKMGTVGPIAEANMRDFERKKKK